MLAHSVRESDKAGVVTYFIALLSSFMNIPELIKLVTQTTFSREELATLQSVLDKKDVETRTGPLTIEVISSFHPDVKPGDIGILEDTDGSGYWVRFKKPFYPRMNPEEERVVFLPSDHVRVLRNDPNRICNS